MYETLDWNVIGCPEDERFALLRLTDSAMLPR
jgi:hypothetical protein